MAIKLMEFIGICLAIYLVVFVATFLVMVIGELWKGWREKGR